MIDGNTAALRQNEAQQDRAERNLRDYQAEAYQNALARITLEQIWDAWHDDPVYALGHRYARYFAAVNNCDYETVGRLTCEAHENLRRELVTMEMIQDEAAKLAADAREYARSEMFAAQFDGAGNDK